MWLQKRVFNSYATRLLLLGPLVSSGSICAEGLEVSAGIEAEHNSNPDNIRVGSQVEEEVEYAGVVSVLGDVEGRFATWSSDLNYEVRRFAEHEFRDYELLLGEAELRLGQERGRVTGELNYSAQEQLINPRDGRTPENLDFRAITGARLFVNLGKKVNRFSVYASAANVEYDFLTSLESRQQGGGLLYQRSTSKTSLFGVDVSGYNLDYKENDDASYDYFRVATSWQQQLRRLEYSLAVGANAVNADKKTTEPYFSATASWREPLNRYQLSIQQWLTDTSQGAGRSDLGAGEAIGSSDGRLAVVDQYTHQEASFSWVNTGICGRCQSTLRLGWQSEGYETFKQEDNTELLLDLGFRYQARQRLALTANLQRSNFDGERVDESDDYDDQRLRLAATWSQIAKRGRLELFAQTLEREFEDDSAFEQDLVGLRFDWLLYQR